MPERHAVRSTDTFLGLPPEALEHIATHLARDHRRGGARSTRETPQSVLALARTSREMSERVVASGVLADMPWLGRCVQCAICAGVPEEDAVACLGLVGQGLKGLVVKIRSCQHRCRKEAAEMTIAVLTALPRLDVALERLDISHLFESDDELKLMQKSGVFDKQLATFLRRVRGSLRELRVCCRSRQLRKAVCAANLVNLEVLYVDASCSISWKILAGLLKSLHGPDGSASSSLRKLDILLVGGPYPLLSSPDALSLLAPNLTNFGFEAPPVHSPGLRASPSVFLAQATHLKHLEVLRIKRSSIVLEALPQVLDIANCPELKTLEILDDCNFEGTVATFEKVLIAARKRLKHLSLSDNTPLDRSCFDALRTHSPELTHLGCSVLGSVDGLSQLETLQSLSIRLILDQVCEYTMCDQGSKCAICVRTYARIESLLRAIEESSSRLQELTMNIISRERYDEAYNLGFTESQITCLMAHLGDRVISLTLPTRSVQTIVAGIRFAAVHNRQLRKLAIGRNLLPWKYERDTLFKERGKLGRELLSAVEDLYAAAPDVRLDCTKSQATLLARLRLISSKNSA